MSKLYNLKRWHRLRLAQLRKEPFCKYCTDFGIDSPATVVDHIKPHRGDETLFFDPENLQSLCKTCHDSAKQRFEKSGSLKGGNVHGFPLDPNHHWNRQ
jgi:5-methylcytosine-specific restriction enzyme A